MKKFSHKFKNALINQHFNLNKSIFKIETSINDLPLFISSQSYDYEFGNCSQRKGFYYPKRIDDVLLKQLNPSYKPIIKVEALSGKTIVTPTDYVPSHTFLRIMDTLGAQRHSPYEHTEPDIEILFNDEMLSKISRNYFEKKKMSSLKILKGNSYPSDCIQLNNHIFNLFKDSHSCPMTKIQRCENGLYLPNTYCPLATLLYNYHGISEQPLRNATLYGHKHTYHVEGFIPPSIKESLLEILKNNGIAYEVEETNWLK